MIRNKLTYRQKLYSNKYLRMRISVGARTSHNRHKVWSLKGFLGGICKQAGPNTLWKWPRVIGIPQRTWPNVRVCAYTLINVVRGKRVHVYVEWNENKNGVARFDKAKKIGIVWSRRTFRKSFGRVGRFLGGCADRFRSSC